ncbi:MAG TPA: CofH family radical SAM protein [Bacteroidales bacterium]|nr:CofH family radical SAM protein [Bacteroidales bacterium]
MDKSLHYFLANNLILSVPDRLIAEKVLRGERISIQDGLHLYEKTGTGLLAVMANHIREKINASNVYYIRNIHLEPTNICVYHCRFCSFSRKEGEPRSWSYTMDEIERTIDTIADDIHEIHITASTHPEASISGYEDIIRCVRHRNPAIHIKAFSAAELYYVFQKERLSYSDGLKILIDAGLNSIPGGGAEIFDDDIRKKICPEKVPAPEWLEIHKAAHENGIFSNATMLYGHIENYGHRIDHMNRLRDLQDETHGFQAFIPLKFKNRNNQMSSLGETILLEDLRNYAVARIFLDNIPHLKAYWPMLGKKQAQLALPFGVDDIDGTIDNSTDIYTAAGVEKTENAMSASELIQMIEGAGFTPVERFSDYTAVNNIPID